MTVYIERRQGVPTGVFLAEVTCGGDRKRERFTDMAQARQWVALSRALGRPADRPGREGSNPKHLFGPVAREARRQRARWKTSRDPSLDQRLDVLVTLIGADTPLADVTLLTVYKVVETLERRKVRGGRIGLDGKTINRYLAVLSGVLTYAAKCGYATAAPPMPWQDELPGRRHILTRTQEDLLCGLLEAESALTLRVLAATAMRPGEFHGLDVDQVDGEWVHLWETKSDKPRSIPLDPALGRMLRAMIREGRRPAPDAFYRAFKDAAERAGLASALTVYSLRHTGLTRLAQAGVSGPVLQKWAGHGSFRTTQNYLHLADEDLMRAAAAVQQAAVRDTCAA